MEDKGITEKLTLKLPKRGSIVKGRIIDISKEDGTVFIDINWKSEGVVKIEDFMKKTGEIEDLSIGREIPVMVENVRDDMVLLSYRKAKRIEILKSLRENLKKNLSIDVDVLKLEKTGYTVYYEGIEGFLPLKEIPKNYEELIGKKISVKILRITDNSFISSLTKHLKEERKKKREGFFKTHKINETVTCTVKGFSEKGVFVDIDGVEGFIYKENISWGRVEKIDDFLKLKEKINAKIIKLDPEKNRIVLSIKHLIPDPWERIEEKFKINDTVQAKVVEIRKDFAVFEIEKGIEGILKKENFSWKKIENLTKHLKKEEWRTVLIKGIDKRKRKLILSLKEFEKNPYTKYVKGENVKGTVVGMERNFAVVEIEKGIYGRIYNEHISTKNVKNPSELLTKWQIIEAKIIKIDTEKGIIELSIKELLKEKERKIIEKYEKKDTAKFILKDILNKD